MTHYCKVGFHSGSSMQAGLGMYMRQLDKAGIPFRVCASGDPEPVIAAAELAEVSGVPHAIALQVSSADGSSGKWPGSSLPADQAAKRYWERLGQYLTNHPSLRKHIGRIWIEPEIEAHTVPSGDFLGWFCHHLGRIAIEHGFRLALPGHQPGHPDPEEWRLPGYQAFLKSCSEQPDKLAVSFHEGKVGDTAAHPETFYPYRIGRFTWMYDACDELGIGRPTTLITRWSWGEAGMPSLADAMRDVRWLSELAAKYPSLQGIFLWQMGTAAASSGLSDKGHELIASLTEYALQARLPGPARRTKPVVLRRTTLAPKAPRLVSLTRTAAGKPADETAQPGRVNTAGPRGKPRMPYKRVYVLLPPQSSKRWVHAVAEATWEMFGYTIGKNPDDAGTGDLASNTVLAVNPHLWGPGEDGNGLEGFFAKYYPNVNFQAVEANTPNQLRSLLPG